MLANVCKLKQDMAAWPSQITDIVALQSKACAAVTLDLSIAVIIELPRLSKCKHVKAFDLQNLETIHRWFQRKKRFDLTVALQVNRGRLDFQKVRCADGCQRFVQWVTAELKLTEPTPPSSSSILTLLLPSALLAWDECPPVQESEGAIIPQEFCIQAETPAPAQPSGHKGALCFPKRWTYTHSCTHSQTQTYIEWGLDSGSKRLYWYTGQACLWHQCCRCYCPPRERTIKEAHTACVYMLVDEGAFCQQLSSVKQQTIISSTDELILLTFYSKDFSLLPTICCRCDRASSPHPTQGCRLPDRLSPASSPPSWDHSACRAPSWRPALLEHLLLTHRPSVPLPQWPRYRRRRSGWRVTEPEQQLWTPAGGL